MATKQNLIHGLVPPLETPVSPYGLAIHITDNSDLDVAPQRMYQYVRSEKLTVELNQLGHKVVTVAEGNRFLEWFLDPERGKKKETEDKEAAASAESKS